MKIGISIGAFMLLCSQALGQVVVNADGTHSIQHGPHIINPNGTISVQHGPHIIQSDGTISTTHGSTIVNPPESVSSKQELLNANQTGQTHLAGEKLHAQSKNQGAVFKLRLGSAADRLDRFDEERKTRKEERRLKKILKRLWQNVLPQHD